MYVHKYPCLCIHRHTCMYMFGKYKVLRFHLQVGTSLEKGVREELCGAVTLRLRPKGRHGKFKGQRQNQAGSHRVFQAELPQCVEGVGPFKELKASNLATKSEERRGETYCISLLCIGS